MVDFSFIELLWIVPVCTVPCQLNFFYQGENEALFSPDHLSFVFNLNLYLHFFVSLFFILAWEYRYTLRFHVLVRKSLFCQIHCSVSSLAINSTSQEFQLSKHRHEPDIVKYKGMGWGWLLNSETDATEASVNLALGKFSQHLRWKPIFYSCWRQNTLEAKLCGFHVPSRFEAAKWKGC